MADQWQELNSDDHGNTIDHTGRIVNDDGAEPHAQIERALTRTVNHTRDVDERPDVDPVSDAAPDLLKASRALADKIAAYGLPPEYLLDEWRAMRSAIAKALGQAQ